MTEEPPFLPGSGLLSRLRSAGRVGASAARLAARRLLGRSGAVDGDLGEAMAAELDRMKGMAMKVGQVLSYIDGVLPEEAQTALRSLQRGVTSMPPEEARRVVEEALGAPVDALFDAWEDDPAAAASLGQVHRARLRDPPVGGADPSEERAAGPVAVKIQYPGVADDIDEDFGRLRLLGRVASLPTAVDGLAIVEELRARVGEECDYRREADAQDAFRRAFADDPRVTIPAVVRSRTAETVLTTSWAEGRSLYEMAADADEEERRAVAATLLRFAHRSFFELCAINADPHPGNYLFPRPGTAVRPGSVVFLDFGCVRRFDPAFVEAERRIARAVVDGRRREFRDAVVEAGRVPEAAGFDWALHWKVLRHQYGPYLDERFHFDTEWVREGMALNGPGNPNLVRLRFPPEWVWLQRLQWGLHAVLARLGAEGAFRDLFLRCLDAPARPLALG